MIGSDCSQSDADYSQSHPDSSRSDEDHGCKASDHLPIDQENGPRVQEDLLVRADCGLRNRDHGLHDADHLHNDGDNGHGRTENGIGRADHGLICQSNFRHRTFDAKRVLPNRRNCEIDEHPTISETIILPPDCHDHSSNHRWLSNGSGPEVLGFIGSAPSRKTSQSRPAWGCAPDKTT